MRKGEGRRRGRKGKGCPPNVGSRSTPLAVAAGSSRPDEAGATMGAVGDVEKSRGDNRAVPEQVTSKKAARNV